MKLQVSFISRPSTRLLAFKMNYVPWNSPGQEMLFRNLLSQRLTHKSGLRSGLAATSIHLACWKNAQATTQLRISQSYDRPPNWLPLNVGKKKNRRTLPWRPSISVDSKMACPSVAPAIDNQVDWTQSTDWTGHSPLTAFGKINTIRHINDIRLEDRPVYGKKS